MDTGMSDVPARTSDYQGSDDNDDSYSVHPSEWATPPHERDASETGGFSHPPTSSPSGGLAHRPKSSPFVESSEGSDDDLPARVSARTLRYNRRSRSHISSPEPSVSEDVYEDDGSLYSVSPTPGVDDPSYTAHSPNLFVSENEATFVVRGETTLSKPENILQTFDDMEGMKRARDIKAEIETNVAVLHPRDKTVNKRNDTELDPEDQLIKDLREGEKLGWAAIAERLNEARRERGEVANFASTSVYSRFVRLSATAVIPMNELGFHPKDYAHLRQAIMSSTGGQISKGKKRVKNYDNPKELDVNMRKPLSKKDEEELETPERSEQLMQAVAKVERNFWVLVADEMERSTTRLYSPTALADRYHAI